MPAQKVMFLALACLVVSVISPLRATTQEKLELPADIVFTSAGGSQVRSTRLIRIDATTLGPSVFYQDETANYLQLAGWSPSGRYLAVLRRPKRDYDVVDICFLRRDGTLETCFDNIASYRLLGGYRLFDDFYSITWSDDEQKVYFIQNQNPDCRLEVVEADITTGSIHRTLYEQEVGCTQAAPTLYLSPSQRYLARYSGENLQNLITSEHTVAAYAREVLTIDLLTGDQHNLTVKIPPERGPVAFCPGWSPRGRFLSARIYTEPERPGLYAFPYRPEVVLVNPNGQIVHTLAADQLAAQGIDFVHCPAWDADETGFYFLAGAYDEEWAWRQSVSIYHYALASDELVEVNLLQTFPPPSKFGADKLAIGPLRVSPGATHIAFSYLSRMGIIGVGILFPDGEVLQYEYPHPVGSPLWFSALVQE